MILFGQENAISYENPDAITILKKRLKRLEDLHLVLKKINTIFASDIPVSEKKYALNQLKSDDLIAFLNHYNINIEENFKARPIEYKLLQINTQRVRYIRNRIQNLIHRDISDNRKKVIYSNKLFDISFSKKHNRIYISLNNEIPKELKLFLKSNNFKWYYYDRAWIAAASPDILDKINDTTFLNTISHYLKKTIG